MSESCAQGTQVPAEPHYLTLCMALQPLRKEGRNRVGKEGRSMEWRAEHWMRRSAWFLASPAAHLLCGLL